MADTTYVDGVTVLSADTMNDLNRLHYTILSDPANAAAVASAIGVGTEDSPTLTGLTLTSLLVAAKLATIAQTQTSVNDATATTLFSVATAGLYIVAAWATNAGSAAYTAHAFVTAEGTDAKITAVNGSNLTLTVSGTNLQVTQTSGAPANIQWTYLKVA